MTRSIQFHKLRSDEIEGKRPPLPLRAAIEALPTTFDTARDDTNMLNEGEGNYLSLHLDGVATGGQLQIRLGRTRMSALPQTHRRGHIKNLDLLDDEGVFEPTHVVLFPLQYEPSTWVAGIEFNQDGPRPTRLGQYLAEKCANLPEFAQSRCSDQETERRLNEMQVIQQISVRMDSASREALEREIPDLQRHLFPVVDQLDGVEVELIIRAKGRGEGLSSRAKQWAETLWHRVPITKLKIKGVPTTPGDPKDLDLLRHFIGQRVEVNVMEGDQRVLNSDDMYAKIQQVFGADRQNIITASSV